MSSFTNKLIGIGAAAVALGGAFLYSQRRNQKSPNFDSRASISSGTWPGTGTSAKSNPKAAEERTKTEGAIKKDVEDSTSKSLDSAVQGKATSLRKRVIDAKDKVLGEAGKTKDENSTKTDNDSWKFWRRQREDADCGKAKDAAQTKLSNDEVNDQELKKNVKESLKF